jgi:hypothetical protein
LTLGGRERFRYVSRHVPLPIVVVEVAPADADRELVQVLVDSCNSAVPRGRCVLEDPDDSELSAPTGVAIVSWQGDGSVRVEVGVQKQARSEWLSQELSFREQDDPEQRWRATGLAIGTLVGEMRWQAQQPAKEPARDPQKDVGQPAPARDRAEPRPAAGPIELRSWLDAGPVAGSALDDGSFRIGAFARGAFQLPESPLFGALSVSYQARPNDTHGIDVTWTTVAGGAGYRLFVAGSRLDVDLRLEGVWQYVRVSASDPISGASGSAASSVFGVRGGADASWTLARPIALLIGAEISGLNRTVDVRLRDERIGTASRLQYALLGGARFWLR